MHLRPFHDLGEILLVAVERDYISIDSSCSQWFLFLDALRRCQLLLNPFSALFLGQPAGITGIEYRRGTEQRPEAFVGFGFIRRQADLGPHLAGTLLVAEQGKVRSSQRPLFALVARYVALTAAPRSKDGVFPSLQALLQSVQFTQVLFGDDRPGGAVNFALIALLKKGFPTLLGGSQVPVLLMPHPILGGPLGVVLRVHIHADAVGELPFLQ